MAILCLIFYSFWLLFSKLRPQNHKNRTQKLKKITPHHVLQPKSTEISFEKLLTFEELLEDDD